MLSILFMTGERGGDFDAIIDKRISSPIILFIGDTRYTSAALELIDSFKELQHKYSNLRLHIIGMTNEQLSINTEQMNIICHGYLHKDREEERDVYYNLLMQAKVFVNPAAQWGGYSSTIEAMYYGCPVIVSPYDDFVAEFGNDIDFGIYHKNKGTLYSEMDAILSLNNNEYKKMSASAANRVKEYTWDNYVYSLVSDLKQLGII